MFDKLQSLVEQFDACCETRKVVLQEACLSNDFSIIEVFERKTYYPLRLKLRTLCGGFGHLYEGYKDTSEAKHYCKICGIVEGVPL